MKIGRNVLFTVMVGGLFSLLLEFGPYALASGEEAKAKVREESLNRYLAGTTWEGAWYGRRSSSGELIISFAENRNELKGTLTAHGTRTFGADPKPLKKLEGLGTQAEFQRR